MKIISMTWITSDEIIQDAIEQWYDSIRVIITLTALPLERSNVGGVSVSVNVNVDREIS